MKYNIEYFYKTYNQNNLAYCQLQLILKRTTKKQVPQILAQLSDRAIDVYTGKPFQWDAKTSELIYYNIDTTQITKTAPRDYGLISNKKFK